MSDENAILEEASGVLEYSITGLFIHDVMGNYIQMFPFVHSYFFHCEQNVKTPVFDEFIAGCPDEMIVMPGATREFGEKSMRTIWDAYVAARDVARREVMKRS